MDPTFLKWFLWLMVGICKTLHPEPYFWTAAIEMPQLNEIHIALDAFLDMSLNFVAFLNVLRLATSVIRWTGAHCWNCCLLWWVFWRSPGRMLHTRCSSQRSDWRSMKWISWRGVYLQWRWWRMPLMSLTRTWTSSPRIGLWTPQSRNTYAQARCTSLA